MPVNEPNPMQQALRHALAALTETTAQVTRSPGGGGGSSAVNELIGLYPETRGSASMHALLEVAKEALLYATEDPNDPLGSDKQGERIREVLQRVGRRQAAFEASFMDEGGGRG